MTLVRAPARRLALRVGPADDAAVAGAALVAHLESACAWGAKVTVDGRQGRCTPSRPRTTGPAYAAARAAFAEAWGRAAGRDRRGRVDRLHLQLRGGVPGGEILITGVEDPDTRAHGAEREPAPRRLRAGLPGRVLLAKLAATA